MILDEIAEHLHADALRILDLAHRLEGEEGAAVATPVRNALALELRRRARVQAGPDGLVALCAATKGKGT